MVLVGLLVAIVVVASGSVGNGGGCCHCGRVAATLVGLIPVVGIVTTFVVAALVVALVIVALPVIALVLTQG